MPLVALSCYKCGVINVYDVGTRDVMNVMTSNGGDVTLRPQYMTQGNHGEIFAVDHPRKFGSKRLKILRFDCTGPKFTLKSTSEKINLKSCHAFVYLPSPYNMLVLTAPHDTPEPSVRAVLAGTWVEAWAWRGVVEERVLSPHGVTYSPEHDSVLVGDYCRLVVLNPRDGSLRGTVEFSGLGMVRDLVIHNKQLIILDINHQVKYRISYWDLF